MIKKLMAAVTAFAGLAAATLPSSAWWGPFWGPFGFGAFGCGFGCGFPFAFPFGCFGPFSPFWGPFCW